MRDLILKYVVFVFIVSIAPIINTQAAFADDTESYENTTNDPLEGLNRGVYKFNTVLDNILFKPTVKTYRFIFPKIARDAVHNAVQNLTEPVSSVNSFLQGDPKNGFGSLWRFTINSTFGIAGTLDVAKHYGFKQRKEDFGQTIGSYGVKSGPYLMLPILGPSNGRDAFGRVVDIFIDPFTYILHRDASFIRAGVTGLDARETTLNLTDQIDKTSLDPYATIRSLYSQRRYSDINNNNY